MSESDGFSLRQVKWKNGEQEEESDGGMMWRRKERRGHEEVEVRKKMDEQNAYEGGRRVEKDKGRDTERKQGLIKDWREIEH